MILVYIAHVHRLGSVSADVSAHQCSIDQACGKLHIPIFDCADGGVHH